MAAGVGDLAKWRMRASRRVIEMMIGQQLLRGGAGGADRVCWMQTAQGARACAEMLGNRADAAWRAEHIEARHLFHRLVRQRRQQQRAAIPQRIEERLD